MGVHRRGGQLRQPLLHARIHLRLHFTSPTNDAAVATARRMGCDGAQLDRHYRKSGHLLCQMYPDPIDLELNPGSLFDSQPTGSRIWSSKW